MALFSRLFALVSVALLPAIIIQSYNEFDLHRSRQIEVQEQALGFATLAAAQQQQIVQGIRQVLIALSELPAVKSKDRQACSAYLSTLKRRYPAFVSFFVVDEDGRSFCTTTGTSVYVADRPYFAEITRTGNFTVGDFTIGRSTGRALIPLALPFLDSDERPGGVILAALSLDWLADFIAQGVPPGAAISIADRKGTYLARYPDNAKFVGRPMPGHQDMLLTPSGTIATTSLSGVERIVGYSTLPSDSGSLLVTVGLDKTQAFSAIERRTWHGALLIALGTALVLILTWFGAHRMIHQPLLQLVDAANQWRLGDYARRVHLRDKCPELSWVAEAFNTMADSLADRERELCQAKDRAEQAAARITTIFESTTDCVIIVDPQWRITYLNERAEAQLAQERDLVGRKFWNALADDLDTATCNKLQEAMSKQHAVSFEKLCVRSDVWYEINAFPSGEGLAVLLRNVTEHRQAVQARRLIEEQLHQSQKMEAVGQLTGGVAHDFNNLLMVISANLELIASASTDRGCVQQLAAAAQQAADRGAKLTAQLLAFSRRQNLNPKPVYADSLIRDFEQLIRRAVGEACELKLSSDDQLWPCYVDPAQLQTALLNLALNGRDAMPKAGMLQIELRNVNLDEDTMAEIPAGSYVRISVRDTGYGMAPDVLARAFEPFFTTKPVGKGTGLGLSMVYGFVRQSGGHVAIESTVGVGTTVSLYLPRSTKLPTVEARVAEPNEVTIGSGRVLLVEDDHNILDVTTTMLTKLGYQVFSARNGTEALHTLRNDRNFDILFSDIVMPQGINGIELAREAKQLCTGLKILLMSGNAADALARTAAVDEFPIIGKPFRRAELAQFLRVMTRDA